MTNEHRVAELQRKIEKINSVSGSFCLAKWLQSTVYLHNGMTHSCHHPPAHKVPLKEIERSPDALHNTQQKIALRQQMRRGDRPSECEYCWNIENLGPNHFSDRHYKSADAWAFPSLEKVLAERSDRVDPTYLEVAFDYACNFKCAYCSPDISSKWMEEIKRHGPYPTSCKAGNLDWLKQSDRIPIESEDNNPYVDAFWQWWPTLYERLHTFRITGGEPLLSKNTWKVLEFIKANPKPDFHFAINTNLGVPDPLIDKLIRYHNDISPKIAAFEIFTSCEAHGRQAEYIRYGLDYQKFIGNIEKFLRNTISGSRVNLMITFNALSATSFTPFLQDIWRLREKYNLTNSMNRIPMMINYLRWPKFLSMRILPDELKRRYSEEFYVFVKRHSKSINPNGTGRFYLEEIDQVLRLGKHMCEPLEATDLQRRQDDFKKFFREYDRRRGCDFISTFPELTSLV